ncbi:MAG: iron chelate uptake ABC transporter family permease subunit [Solirubrobacteraceae bacterium]|nr:iron chelate uptake ABC transporter family permease subunit [Solirubrobacteraceae bacterium]
MSARAADPLWPRRFRRVRIGALDAMVDVRSALVVAVLLLLTLLASGFALTLGDTPTSLGTVWDVVTGGGDDGVRRVLLEWRLPRVAAAAVAGAGLGVSGAVFQTLTRNPLGSPDIIGFSSGAYTGALVGILVVGNDYVVTALGALAGGVLTALAVYGLAYQRGVQGYRLIVIGIGVSAMLNALNNYLILQAGLEQALSAAAWGAGTLSDLTWTDAGPMIGVVLLLLPAALLVARGLRLLEMGDDAALALGVRAERVRLLAVLVGVGLSASVVAVAGPIAFVALSAPQIAQRLTGTAGVTFPAAAAMGALLLAVSDVVAREALPDDPLPVGVVTVCVGGGYLLWLLISQSRKA